MKSTRGKVSVLAALVAVWALIFFFRQTDEPPGRPAPSQAGPRTSRVAGAGGATGGLPRLKTEYLKVPRPPYPSEVQNIFSSPPPPPPPPAPSAGAGAAGVAPPPPPPDPFQEEAKQFRYVGFLQSDGTATAFIVRGQEVHTVPVGGNLGAQFRVSEVREDSVLLTSPTGEKQVRLALAGDASAASRAPEMGGPPRPPLSGPRPPGIGTPPQPPDVHSTPQSAPAIPSPGGRRRVPPDSSATPQPGSATGAPE